MATLFTQYITPIFTAAMNMLQTISAVIIGGTVGVGEAAVTYTASPVLALFVFIPVAFLGVNFFRKLLRL